MVISGISWFSKLSFVAHSTSHIESELSIPNDVVNELSIQNSPCKKLDLRSTSPESNFTLPAPTDLLRFCRNGEWKAFVERCREEPHKLTWVRPHGQNLLHIICTRRPDVQSVMEFVEIYPQALLKEDKDGCLPIHMAMTNGASHQVISTLISHATATVLHTNKWHYHPLDWIWRRCKYELLSVEREDFCEEETIWKSISIMVQAASDQSGALQDGSMLHMAMDFKCPIDLVEYIINKFPNMTNEKDSMGRIPLARAFSSTQTPSVDAIRLLLKANPATAMVADSYGRLPFHLAIFRQISWDSGLHDLFNAAPLVLLVIDPITNLLPFQLIASVMNGEETDLTLSDIYEVLSRCPASISIS
jgi:hypothetical protein